MPKVISDDLVRRIRERVWHGEDPIKLAEEYQLRVRVIRRMVRGETHKKAGGPICESARRRGERRSCTRCRLHYDEDQFIFKRDSRTGICVKCERPEDKFLKLDDREARSQEIRRKHDQRREQLMVEVEALMSAPLIDSSLIPDEEREEIYNSVLRQRHKHTL